MRHNRKGRKLSRSASHRRAMLRNLVTSLFEHERVTTTIAKAKEARSAAERLITAARGGGLAARRRISAYVRSEDVARKLMDDIGPRFATRPGGYTRIYRLGPRHGDAGEVGILELVDRKVKESEKKDGKKAAGEKAAGKKGKKAAESGVVAPEVAAEAAAAGQVEEEAARAEKGKGAKKKAARPQKDELPGGRKTKATAHEKRTQATRKSGGRQKSSREG